MTLTLTLKLKIALSTLLPPGAYCSVSQTSLDFSNSFPEEKSFAVKVISHDVIKYICRLLGWVFFSGFTSLSTIFQSYREFEAGDTQQAQIQVFGLEGRNSARGLGTA